MIDILKKLVNAVSVSGAEEAVSDEIRELIAGCSDEIKSDALGNLIAVKKSSEGNVNAKKIMTAAHMDEIGFIVTFIEDSGFIRVSRVGGINWISAAYGEILFKNGLHGVIVPEGNVKPNEYDASKMYIDIGAKDKADAEIKVKIGDTCTIAPKIITLMNNRIAAAKLDNKISCAVLIQTLLNMKNTKLESDLYFVFTAQEEVGLRGARTAAQFIMPDYSIAVDVTRTGDTPECLPMATKIGDGAAIKLMDSSVICHKDMVNLLMQTAKENNIKYQSEILAAGGTDTAVMQSAGAGSIAGAISVPTRYMHSGAELCSMDDVQACVDLLGKVLKKI
ncbi:MAG: M20/M25/M40 family metallo-hydrolase [Oscillospiraceae bacterium]|nr:M20/M25/M40 family metallo-hydrolase [Oscillospiraceae bacterium]